VPSVKIRTFIWETFASHYLELVKCRAYNNNSMFSSDEQEAAHYTMYAVVDALLRILAPIIPFATQILYKNMFDSDVHKTEFPKKLDTYMIGLKTDEIIELNSAVWKMKKDRKLSLKAEVQQAILPEAFSKMQKDIAATHNIKEIIYGEKMDFKIYEINI
jgi:valyl-tRNA synthetase